MDNSFAADIGKRKRIIRNYAELSNGKHLDEEKESASSRGRRIDGSRGKRGGDGIHVLRDIVLNFESELEDLKVIGSAKRKGGGSKRSRSQHLGGNMVKLIIPDDLDDELSKFGFIQPWFVRGMFATTSAKLGVRLPQDPISMQQLLTTLGSEYEVKAVNVTSREEEYSTMSLSEWDDYWSSEAPRQPVLMAEINGIQNSALATMLSPPAIVDKLDLTCYVWPSNSLITAKHQNKVLIHLNSAGTFRDFRISSGGSSQWYHVLKGKKVMLLAPPTDPNLSAFEEWRTTNQKSCLFLADGLDDCHRIDIDEGDTLFLPSGWLHCEATPLDQDSITLSGQFLTRQHFGRQLEIWSMEDRMAVPVKNRYPQFKTISWYAARWYLDNSASSSGEDSPLLSQQEKDAMPLLIETLATWLQNSKEGREANGSPWSPRDSNTNIAALKAIYPGNPPKGRHSAVVPTRIRLSIRPPAKVKETPQVDLWSSSRGRRRKAKKLDSDFVGEEDLEEELKEMEEGDRPFDGGDDDKADEDEVLEDEESEDDGEDIGEDEWEGKSPRQGSKQSRPPRTQQPKSKFQSAMKLKAVKRAPSNVRERLLAKIGLDHRVPLPAPKRNAHPVIRKTVAPTASTVEGGAESSVSVTTRSVLTGKEDQVGYVASVEDYAVSDLADHINDATIVPTKEEDLHVSSSEDLDNEDKIRS